MTIRVVLTAGGTTDPWDAVRNVSGIDIDGLDGKTDWARFTHEDFSNISKGTFPYAIARELVALSTAENSVEVTVIGKRELVAEHRATAPSGISFVPFRSFADLTKAIESETGRRPVDIFAMGAAVSDYSPIPSDGKISSDLDEITVKFKRNPKLLDALRARIGEHALLVGFKLLADVPPARLHEVAQRQCTRCGCDLTIANDMALINWETGRHPIALVNSAQVLWELDAHRDTVARQVAMTLLRSWTEKNHPAK